MNYANSPEMPMGLGMALAQNAEAMNCFSSLSKAEQQRVIDGTHAIGSAKEMQSYVQALTTGKI